MSDLSASDLRTFAELLDSPVVQTFHGENDELRARVAAAIAAAKRAEEAGQNDLQHD